VMPEPVAPQPRIAKPDHAGLLDRTFTRLRHMATAIFAAPAENPAVPPHQGRRLPLRVGTRGSPLALVQTRAFLAVITHFCPVLRTPFLGDTPVFQEHVIRTTGDAEQTRRLAEIGRTRVPENVTIIEGEIQETLVTIRSASEGDTKSNQARFDVAIASLVLHYIDPLEPLFRLIASVLVDGDARRRQLACGSLFGDRGGDRGAVWSAARRRQRRSVAHAG